MKRRIEESSQWAGRVFWLALVLILVIVTSGSGSAQGQGQGQGRGRSLFTRGAEADAARPAQVERGKKRGRRVRANVAAVTAGDAAAPGDDILTLNLFDDVEVRARRRGSVDHPRPGGTLWRGELLDMPGEATIAVNGDVMAGTVFADDRVFEIRYVGDGEHEVREIDQAQFPTDDPPFEGDLAPDVPGDAVVGDAAVAGDSANQIDVMVVWTPAARVAAGGTAAMQSVVDVSVANANTSYANSNVTQRLRLVYSGEISFTEGAISTDLSRLSGPSDGYLDTVHSLRNTYGADMVTLLGEGYANAGSCGIGYLMTSVYSGFASNAFNVVDWGCAAGNLSYAHELGHNMGLHHDPANASGAGAYSYAYGYQEPTGAFRTVMAYPCPSGGCPRLMRFSNPSLTYNGKPTGTSSHNNALALNNTAPTVANFRQAVGGGTCSYSIGASSTSVSSSASSASVAVTAGSGCSWTASSNAAWVSITSGTPGSGNGNVGFSVQANTGALRAGTLTIAGHTFTVSQAAAACGAFSVSPASQNLGAAGGSVTLTVSGTTGCARTATSNAAWITVTSGASATGSGYVYLSVEANTSASSRTGTVTVGGTTFSATQAAAACGAFSLSPASTSAGSAGGGLTVNVTGGASCARTATSNAAWITVTSGASGSGSGAVGLNVSANTAGTSRTGTVTIGGQTFSVTQSAAACGAFSLSPVSTSVAAAGGAVSVGVTGTASCARTATSNATWITVTSGASGTGSGTVGLNVSANTAGTSRTGTATIGGQTFSVTQSAAACGAFTLSPASTSIVAAGGSVSVGVTGTASCARTATSNASWITVTSGGSGTGSGTVTISVAANTGGTSRTGTATIAGQTFSVTQAAASCGAFTLSPTSQSAIAAGGTVSTIVTGTVGCSRTATSNASWITVTAGATGTGTGTVSTSVAANVLATPRTGTVTIAGLTFTVNQAAAASCTYTLSPTSASVPGIGGTGSFSLTTASGCTAAATDNASWLTLTAGATGSGSRTISFSAAANTGAARFATVSVGGQTVRVNQAKRSNATKANSAKADFDGDLMADVLWQQNNGSLSIWKMDGVSVRENVLVSPADPVWMTVGSGDLNGDGHPEVLWRHRTQGWIVVWYMNGTTAVGSAYLNPGQVDVAWKIVGIADVNGDQKSDLLWQHDQGTLAVWYMNGTTMVGGGTLNPPGIAGNDWQVVGVGDMNGDAKPDLVWQQTSTGLVAAWLLNGITATSTTLLNPGQAGSGWRIRGVVDIDADGKTDLLWQHTSGQTRVWLMNGINVISSTDFDQAALADFQLRGPR